MPPTDCPKAAPGADKRHLPAATRAAIVDGPAGRPVVQVTCSCSRCGARAVVATHHVVYETAEWAEAPAVKGVAVA